LLIAISRKFPLRSSGALPALERTGVTGRIVGNTKVDFFSSCLSAPVASNSIVKFRRLQIMRSGHSLVISRSMLAGPTKVHPLLAAALCIRRTVHYLQHGLNRTSCSNWRLRRLISRVRHSFPKQVRALTARSERDSTNYFSPTCVRIPVRSRLLPGQDRCLRE
jgi:hypothetical protein